MKIRNMILVLGISLALTGCGTSGNQNSEVKTTNSTLSGQQTSNSNSGLTDANSKSNQTSGTTGSLPSQTGITGDTKIINLTSPTSNQSVKAGATITVEGTVVKDFENQKMQVSLFSDTSHGSKTLQVQTFQVGSNGHFSVTFTVPNSLPPSGTKMAFVLELLVKGGPQIQTTLTAQ